MAWTSAAQDAATIRAKSKALGWGRKEISVRCENFSMGSAVNVEVKSPTVDVAKAEKILKDVAERIRRDGYGEILSGGNRYVHFGHSHECQEILARQRLRAARRLHRSHLPGVPSAPGSGRG